ncbi:hypothetical protein F7725_014616 [Dissostichus mawsoni]|uniref:Oxysterol-binding protein n=1 Tax=Dissostichus mawsoni TaxID=36200 RepID=A0A7J5Z0S0_DISMA|nr:hypothetical protein F7725_014616 [Dissostichus mawsoni]
MESYGSSLNRSQSLASGLEKSSPKWKPSHSRSSSTVSSRQVIKDWEVIDDLQVETQPGGENPPDTTIPGICEGYLLKRRKWPLKGWHKRYFVLEAGYLRYSKNQHDVTIGRVQGSLDVSLAVMTVNKKSNRIDLDTGDILYHLKAKSHELFYIWFTKLQAHRLYKKAAHGHSGILLTHGGAAGQAQRNGDLSSTGMLPSANTAVNSKNLLLEKPKKPRSGKIWHSRTLSRVEALGKLSSSHLSSSPQLGASVPSIPDYVYSQLSPPTVTSPEGKKVHQDICTISLRVLASLKSVHETLSQERQKLQEIWEPNNIHQSNTLAEVRFMLHLSPGSSRTYSPVFSSSFYFSMDSLQRRHTYPTGLPQWQTRLQSILTPALTSFVMVPLRCLMNQDSVMEAPPTLSQRKDMESKRCRSQEHRLANDAARSMSGQQPRKDLARVSMPVPLNEPVTLLQRLCEELEYSELLDTANNTPDPYQRMVYIAAFAISGYSTATFRNRYKPFNPVLGETYECVREDRGFSYISEQVCHHPPISACHAHSENYSFWQDQRWKNKFWGKSLEILPTGMVNVTLSRYGDHYEWNKVVTCIHNVLSQQRYLEHYGEVTISNLKSNVCTCKITFVKSRYWGSDTNKNEVQGTVLDQSGSIIHRFGGLWHEGIFCDTLPTPKCVWKPNPQPKDHLIYYGFSDFAMDLNELPPDLTPLLPLTDSRLRPDQRMLEEGNVDEAEAKKDFIEEYQRERRKELAKRGKNIFHVFSSKKAKDSCGRDVWLTNGTYWKVRENPGFTNVDNLTVW